MLMIIVDFSDHVLSVKIRWIQSYKDGLTLREKRVQSCTLRVTLEFLRFTDLCWRAVKHQTKKRANKQTNKQENNFHSSSTSFSEILFFQFLHVIVYGVSLLAGLQMTEDDF